MSSKTFNKYFTIDSINISLSFQEKDISQSIYFTFPEFKNLTIFSYKPNITKIDILQILDKYMCPDYFKLLKKNDILNDILNEEKTQYVLQNILNEKYFSIFLPEIPLIKIIENNKAEKNNMVFYKDKLIGIFIDESTIIPVIVLFNIIKNLILNDGIYIIDNQINFDVLETILNENQTQHFFLSLNESLIIKCEKGKQKFKFHKGDIIFNLNGNSFNKNGKIYSEKLKLYVSINTYLMINGSNLIDLNFLPQSKSIDEKNINCTHMKNVQIILPIFNQSQLKIPIIEEDKIYKYNNLEFKILTEKLMETYLDCPLSKNQFDKNHLSEDKYIVLTNHSSKKLYILNKISNKKIENLEEMIEYINKNDSKKTFNFERIDFSLNITI
jgi:hypothetical protein